MQINPLDSRINSMNNNLPIPKSLTACTILYMALLIYASLMPYDFSAEIDYKRVISHAWSHWPFNAKARISGSDIVSNLALYIPLGFLIASVYRHKSSRFLPAFITAVLAATLLSLCIELTQGITLSRTASATDWLLNTISAASGAVIGAKYGQTLWSQGTLWIRHRWDHHPLDILTLFFTLLLITDALAPFLPTILLSQIWRSVKVSHWNIIEGFAQHPWHWWLFTRVLVYMILTMLIACWNFPGRTRPMWGKAFFIAVSLALFLDFSKLLIVSRSLNLANIISSIFGAFVACTSGRYFLNRLKQQRKLEWSIFAIIIYVLYLAWTPFNFTWDPQIIKQKIPSAIQLLPLYHYAMGATLDHVRLFLQSILLQGAFIYFLRLRYAKFEKKRFKIPLAILIVGLLGFMQEGGQLLLPSRTPSMTDIYCFMIGGIIGATLPLKAAMISKNIQNNKYLVDDISTQAR